MIAEPCVARVTASFVLRASDLAQAEEAITALR